MSIVVMFIEEGKRHAELVALKRVASQTSSALLLNLLDTLSKVLHINETELASKLVWFSSDGCSVMMGSVNGVSTQLGALAPFMEPLHCCAHRLALVSQQLVRIGYFQQIEDLLKGVNMYFCNSAKRLEELRKWQKALGCDKLNVLRVSESRWLSVHGCMTQYMRMMPPLLETLYKENKALYLNMTELTTLLSMKAFDHALTRMSVVMKQCQERDVQCDQVAESLDELQNSLKAEYIQGNKTFQRKVWKDFTHVGGAETNLKWKDDKLTFDYNGRMHFLVVADPLKPERLVEVTRPAWANSVAKVKAAASKGASALLDDLKKRFFHNALLSAFAVLLPSYWFRNKVDQTVDPTKYAAFMTAARHKFDKLRARYGATSMRVGAANREVDPLIDYMSANLSGKVLCSS